jgi:hypothetical protein
MKLDPVSPRWVTTDGGIVAVGIACLRPSPPADPQIDYAGRFKMSDFPAVEGQGGLVRVAGTAFLHGARGEHGRDEGVPSQIVLASGHVHDGKRGPAGIGARRTWHCESHS